MKPRVLVVFGLGLVAAPLCAGTAYKWVDEQGKTHYTDQPPPSSARSVQQKRMGANTIETSQLPYGVRDAVKKFPVTLYGGDCGELCTRARDFLNRRGVPHAERNPQQATADFDALKKLTGRSEVPALAVGNSAFTGFDEDQWANALDLAGYPKTASLPRTVAAPAARREDARPGAPAEPVRPEAPAAPAPPR